MENTGFAEITKERLHFSGPGFWFCEIAVTDRCNFCCTYCNRLNGELDFSKTCDFIDSQKGTLRHIQLTGGEPVLYPRLPELCRFINDRNIGLGISTNGSAEYEFYESLSATMFSISLDNYDEDVLIRRGFRNVPTIKNNIRRLSKTHYVNVGLVVDAENCLVVEQIIDYILDLGVRDIKLSISTKDEVMPIFGNRDYSKYPILNYRVGRFRQGKSMRGILDSEDFKCALVKNDMSIVGDKHYPCLVYAREGGSPIGVLSPDVENVRELWHGKHQPRLDPICQQYCMDFKCEYNREHHRMLEDRR